MAENQGTYATHAPMDDPNPYASPTTISQPIGESGNTQPGSRRLIVLLTVAAALNSIVCWLMAGSLIDRGNIAGVLAGLALLIIIGVAMIRLNRWWGEALVSGSFVVALTQLVPIIQMIAGTIALSVVHASIDEDGILFSDPVTAIQAFFATLITGGLIMSFGLVVGVAGRLLLRK